MGASSTRRQAHVALIGSAGLPNRYGGFEAFVEHCGPEIATKVRTVTVTCDATLYEHDRSSVYRGVRRRFIALPANGGWSTLHDLLAFISVFRGATHIVVLGVSGGPWFPLFRLACALARKRLAVNIDGVEWRRAKFSRARRHLLRIFDALAQVSAHAVVYDNRALRDYVLPIARRKSREIPYSGDHVMRLMRARRPKTALTVCRIEPENNIAMLIEGAKRSTLAQYTIVGNWSNNEYARQIRRKGDSIPGLTLLDPIYDHQRLAELREDCAMYIHGHSVGGTNPSLVEMLFYDCQILCFDCPFNRDTAEDCALYFRDADQLAALASESEWRRIDRSSVRRKFLRSEVAERYVSFLCD